LQFRRLLQKFPLFLLVERKFGNGVPSPPPWLVLPKVILENGERGSPDPTTDFLFEHLYFMAKDLECQIRLVSGESQQDIGERRGGLNMAFFS
jgi:hypothetical protein